MPEEPRLEKVSDFFADDTLGFASDSSHVETAGPGRLTILGFVPKSTGSLRLTVPFLFGLLLTGAGLVCFWRMLPAMGKTKGVTANNYISFVQKRTDVAQWALVQERMGPEAREALFGQPILTMGFVDFGAVIAMLRAADAVIGKGDGALLRQASFDNQMSNLNGIYRALMPLVSVEFLVSQASKLWRRYHDTGRMTCERTGATEVQLTLWDYPAIPQHHAPEIEGAFEALLEVAKVKNPRIQHTQCTERGDPHCRWALTWTS